MTNYQKFGLIAGQFFAGLGLAIIGAILTLIVLDIFYELRHIQIYIYANIGGIIGMLIGIWYSSYYLFKSNQQSNFKIHIIQSVFGLCVGLVILYIIDNQWDFILFLPIPLITTIGGFNFRLFKKLKN